MKKIIIVLAFFLTQNLYANQFLTMISDIDDTVKMTALKANKKDTLWYAPGSTPFYGISDLYVYFLCHKTPQKGKCIQDRAQKGTFKSIIYVTGAPPGVHRLGLAFLDKNSYPLPNNVVHKPKLRMSTYEYKKKVISDIVSMYPNKAHILLGDNGEYDPKAYSDVKKAFPKNVKEIFIHYVYKTEGDHHKIESGQIPYLTAVDLGIHFLNNGWIGNDDFEKILDGSIEDLGRKLTHVTRRWMSCKDFFQKNYFPKINIRDKAKKFEQKLWVFRTSLQAHQNCR